MRLLLVSPRFPPSSAADSQRLRMLLPHFASCGAEVEVLAVDPGCVDAPRDAWQETHLPASIPIHRVRGLPLAFSRLPGLGNLEARCLPALARTGDRLLADRRSSRAFDAVLFSTTAFGCFGLGRRWRRRYGVPFLLDYQDPWVNDYYREHPEVRPPGGRLKYAVASGLQRRQEPRVLRQCSGLIAVSEAYITDLRQRYSWAGSIPALTLPFPGSALDFQQLSEIPAGCLPFDPLDGLLHWVSIGRGGADLTTALDGLFGALACHASPDLLQRLRLHFIGTSYAPAGCGIPSIQPLAARHGLAHLVQEITDRLPLSIALACLKAADALLVIGSNDPAYTASKIYPYLLAARPLLAVMHRQSSVCELLQRCGGGRLASFEASTSTTELAARIDQLWLQGAQYSRIVPLDTAAFAPHTAEAQAAKLVQFIGSCITPAAPTEPA